MARIRTIKPEFWRSPDTASASPLARLLYIAMWNWADDSGRGEADLKALEGFAFPNDDVHELSGGTSDNFRDLMAEVVECFDLDLYVVDGRPYYAIPAWEKHQRNERTAKGKYPGPENGVTCTVSDIGGNMRKFRRNTSEIAATSVPGTGEQGNRGTGVKDLPDADASSDTPTELASIYPRAFEQWWEHYPLKTGKRKALEAWKRARRRATDEQLIDGAKRYANDPNRNDKFTKYPEGWLNRDGWLDELIPTASAGTDWDAL